MTTQCAAAGAPCPAGNISVACAMSSRCASGDVCCASLTGIDTVTGVECAAVCTTPDAVVVCETGEPGSCPGGGTCTPYTEGYGFCTGSSGSGTGTSDARAD